MYDVIANREHTTLKVDIRPLNNKRTSNGNGSFRRTTEVNAMTDQLTSALFGGALGIAAGLAFNRVAVFQVKRRVRIKDESKLTETELAEKKEEADRRVESISNVVLAVVWAIISGLLFAAVFAIKTDIAQRLECIAYISLAGAIGAVDLDIRKIPNLSILALLIIRTAAIVYSLVTKQGTVKEIVFPALIGLAIAFVLFQLPTLFRIPIGIGDVKFAAAIGYCLGLFGFLQAAIIMAAGLMVLLIYLTATKKGGRKTKVPMGPFLAAGSMIAIIWPWFEEVSETFFTQIIK